MASLSLHRPLSSQASTSRRLAQRLAVCPSSLPLASLSISSSSPSARAFSSSRPTRDDDEDKPKQVKRQPHLQGEYVPSGEGFHKPGDFVPNVYRGPGEGATPVAMDRASNDDLWKWARNAGSVWKWPTPGQRNWLGGDLVYPANPYFRPSPPLSCDVQAEVYEAYTQFPPDATSLFRINALTKKYKISKDRIRAIIKTGQVAESWKKLGIPPCKPFSRGMDAFLCVPAHRPKTDRSITKTSPALTEFNNYIGSRIDIERDEESDKLERGERTRRIEDNGFSPWFEQGTRIGSMSWEFAEEGHLPTTFKIDMEKPLRPPPRLPMFPSKVVDTNKEAVWNFVNVGDKFAGQGWDGAIHERKHTAPSKKGAVRLFLPLVKGNAPNLSGRRDPTLRGADVLSPREKKRLAYLDKEWKREKGIYSPRDEIINKMKANHPGRLLSFEKNEATQVRKRAYRDKMAEWKANRRVRDRVEDVAAFKDKLAALAHDPK